MTMRLARATRSQRRNTKPVNWGTGKIKHVRVGSGHACGGGLIDGACPTRIGQAGVCLPADVGGAQCRPAGSIWTDTCDAGEHGRYCCRDVCDDDGTCC